MSVPIQIPVGRLLRVAIYSRYSTEDQNPRSIHDQEASVQRFLRRQGIEDRCKTKMFSDAGVSGEKVSRPGIDALRQGCNAGEFDVAIAEESSRFFRHPAACVTFFEISFDRGVRVICLNDNIDTAEKGWRSRLLDRQKSHAEANDLTRERIERSFEARWEDKHAVSVLKPGYARKHLFPELVDPERKRRGPFVDEIDPPEAAKILQAFTSVADDCDTASVARQLSELQLRRNTGRRGKPRTDWEDTAVIRLIRDRIYIGTEDNGKTSVDRKLSTGETRTLKNEQPTRSREMAHLRIVPDALWLRANRAIDARIGDKDQARGENHPLFSIPRDSRMPLSGLFFCSVCGEKMYADGRNEGGYRCSISKKGNCWNLATALREITHHELSRAISASLLRNEDTLIEQAARVIELCADVSSYAPRERELAAELRKLESKISNLKDAIEDAPRAQHAELLTRLNERQLERISAAAALDEVRSMMTARSTLPSPDQAKQALAEAANRLLSIDNEARDLLKRLVDGRIEAVPYRQFGTDKIVLRARLKLRLLPLLPSELRRFTQQDLVADAPALQTSQILVDLFEPPRYIGCIPDAVAARDAHPSESPKRLAKRLGINHMVVYRALEVHDQMIEQGYTDAYQELTSRPATASRWRPKT